MPRRPSASICRCRKLRPQSKASGKAVRVKAPTQSCFRSPVWDAARAWSQPSACLDLCGCGKRRAEWPIVIGPCAHDVQKNSNDQDYKCIANFSKKILSREKNVCEADDCQYRGNRVKPHAERARHI